MLSITTSLYKSEKFLPAFLKNAKKIHNDLSKNSFPFEHILIVNDASKIELELIERANLPFKVISIPRESLYASWNRGVKESLYPLITFWSVDDKRFTKALLEGKKTLDSGNDATYFPYVYKRYAYFFSVKILLFIKKVNPIDYDKEKFIKGMYAGPHFMFTKKAFEKNGAFDESFKIAGDFDWWSRAAKNNLRIKKTNALSGIFTNDGKTLSGSKNELQEKENNRIGSKTY